MFNIRFKTLLAVVCALLLSQVAFGPGRVGNTGDVIICKKSSENGAFREGVFAGDFVFTNELEASAFFSNDQNLSVDKSFMQIKQVLRKLNVGLEDSFSEFVQDIGNRSFWKKYVWETALSGLPQGLASFNDDEDLSAAEELGFAKIPINCKRRIAIVRWTSSFSGRALGSPLFSFEPKLIAAFNQQKMGWQQQSMLFVHEWLWEWVPGKKTNIRLVRKVNRFLHSQLIADLLERGDVETIHAKLKGLGWNAENPRRRTFEEVGSTPNDQIVNTHLHSQDPISMIASLPQVFERPKPNRLREGVGYVSDTNRKKKNKDLSRSSQTSTVLMELIHTTSFWNEDTSDVQVFGIEKMLEKLDAGKMPKMIAIQVGGASWRAKISEQLEKYTELGGVAVFVPEKWDSGAQSSLVKTKKGVYHLQHKEGDSAVSARNLLYGIASAAGFPEFESDGLGKTVLPDSLVLRGDDKLEYTLEAKVRRGWVFGSFNVSGKTVKIQKGTFDTQTGITYLALRDQSIIRGFYKGQRFNGSLHLESTDKPIILEEIK